MVFTVLSISGPILPGLARHITGMLTSFCQHLATVQNSGIKSPEVNHRARHSRYFQAGAQVSVDKLLKRKTNRES